MLLNGCRTRTFETQCHPFRLLFLNRTVRGDEFTGSLQLARLVWSLITSPMNGLTRLTETLWDNRWGNLGLGWSTFYLIFFPLPLNAPPFSLLFLFSRDFLPRYFIYFSSSFFFSSTFARWITFFSSSYVEKNLLHRALCFGSHYFCLGFQEKKERKSI